MSKFYIPKFPPINLELQEQANKGFSRFLSLDYGEKYIGVGMYLYTLDPYPVPYDKIQYQSDWNQNFKAIEKIINDESIDCLILGVPYFLDGKESSLTKKIKQFGLELQSYLKLIPVYYQDETLTTYEAQSRMLQSPRYNFKVDDNHIDALAASIILEDFIKRMEVDNQIDQSLIE